MIQGLAKEIVSMATEEMETGLQKLWGEIFYIETIVGADKIPPQSSQKKPFRQPKKV